MSLFELYILFTISSIGNFFVAVAVITFLMFGVVTVISFVCWAFDNSSQGEKMFKATRWWLIVPVVLGLLATAIPARKDMLMIAGLYYASNIEGINKLPVNVVQVLNNTLSTYATEIIDEATKQKKK